MSKRKQKRAEDDDGSDSEESLINVDFDFFDPNPKVDYTALKRLLNQLFQTDGEHLALHELADLILSQPLLGTTVKIDGIESDPYAYLSVLNMHVHQNNASIKAIREYILSKSEANPTLHATLQQLLAPEGLQTQKHVGFIFSERLINMPVQVVPPMYKMLADEIKWANEENEPYAFTHYLIITRTYRLTPQQLAELEESEQRPSKKPKTRLPPATTANDGLISTYSFHPEDEYIQKHATFTSDYTHTTKAPREDDSFGLDVAGRLMLIPAENFQPMIDEMFPTGYKEAGLSITCLTTMSLQALSTQNLFNVKGKIALVTGGGSGIGKMIAAGLVANGAKVYIAARKEKQLKAAAEELNAAGPGKCFYIIADLSSRAGCDALCSEFKKQEDKLHILVNNSGVTWGAPFDNFPEKEGWDRVLGVNVKSIFYTTSGLSDLLAKDATNIDPGRVINISSVAGYDTHAEDSVLSGKGHGLWSYSTSKAAANHLTRLLAVTLIHRNITVNAILPGVFPSNMTAFGFKVAGDKMAAHQPTGRVGAPTDMAGVALFLCSPASAHMTGGHLIVDGGSLITTRRLSPDAAKL
ncbi:rhamnolipids biosynthesis 3-oxoacyl-reductase [Pyrrhoderma noxium]|uniref:Rhamnolipids biosynthesis 3-oxoacyl-reductase n=1 Tax=Pyrrhoderma noxium TaxID=2282107 RepID=A0A286UPX3_9AGAM|nr:rhamnolipids biosynthesis 3-oxoacyl-reductase [Pyrrhoderma noxium]